MRRVIAAAAPGTLLASERQLAKEFGISVSSANLVMRRLAEEGLIRKVHGKGNLVSETAAHAGANERRTVVFADASLNASHPFWGARLRGVVETAQELRYHLQIVYLRGDESHEDRAEFMSTVSRPEVAGLIYPFGQHSFLDRLWGVRPHLAVVSERPVGNGGPAATVMLDLAGYGAAAVRELAQAGSHTPLVVAVSSDTIAGALAGAAVLPDMRPGHLHLPHIGRLHLDEIAKEIAAKKFDGLLFDDDVLAAKTMAVLAAGGLFPPAVSTVNTGGHPPLPEHVKLYEFSGYEAGRLLMAALDSLIRNGLFAGSKILLQPAPVPSTHPAA